MLATLKSALDRALPPRNVYWLRSVKRAMMGERPLPWPYGAEQASTKASDQSDSSRRMQDRALEKLLGNKIHAPYLFFEEDDILILTAKEIARALTLSVQYLNNAHVNGDVVEFGTMGGFTARTLAAAMVFDPRRQPITDDPNAGDNPFRKLQLFDSFEGLPEITSPIDLTSPHVVSGAWSKGGCKVLAAPELRAMLERILPPERIRIHEGWFADTVQKLPANTRFAMIHFDGDLYQSTMDALVPCFSKGFISRGAVLCFDEWNVNRSIPSHGERRAWSELVERFQIEASHSGDYAACGTKFIIHSYQGMSPVD